MAKRCAVVTAFDRIDIGSACDQQGCDSGCAAVCGVVKSTEAHVIGYIRRRSQTQEKFSDVPASLLNYGKHCFGSTQIFRMIRCELPQASGVALHCCGKERFCARKNGWLRAMTNQQVDDFLVACEYRMLDDWHLGIRIECVGVRPVFQQPRDTL